MKIDYALNKDRQNYIIAIMYGILTKTDVLRTESERRNRLTTS